MADGYKSVQIRGKDNILKAYQNWDIPAWSFWDKKQLLSKYDGDDAEQGYQLLEQWIKMIDTGTNAIYTLKVHEDLKGEKIKENTVASGSINVRLNMDDQMVTNSQYQNYNRRSDFDDRLKRIEDLLTEEVDDEPEEPDMMKKIQGFIESPTISGILAKVLKIDPVTKPSTMGGIPEDKQLEQGMKILKENVPNLGKYIYKLAQIRLHNPVQFQFLLSTLDGMQ